MQSDPWWSLAMAVNVFLVFFFAANPNSFRSYLWLYSLVCFGLPGVPAVICLFYMPTGTKMYGNATVSLAIPPLRFGLTTPLRSRSNPLCLLAVVLVQRRV
jgi:hypothetical protein